MASDELSPKRLRAEPYWQIEFVSFQMNPLQPTLVRHIPAHSIFDLIVFMKKSYMYTVEKNMEGAGG